MDGVQLSQGYRATMPLRGDSLFLTMQSPEIPGSQKDKRMSLPLSQPVVQIYSEY